MKRNKSIIIFLVAVVILLLCFLLPKFGSTEKKYSKKDVKISFEDKESNETNKEELSSEVIDDESNALDTVEGIESSDTGSTEVISEGTEEVQEEQESNTEQSTIPELPEPVDSSGDVGYLDSSSLGDIDAETLEVIIYEVLFEINDENLVKYISPSCNATLATLGINEKSGDVTNLNLETKTFDFKCKEKTYNLVYTVEDGLITSISLKQ